MEKLHASFEEVSRQDTSAPVMTGGEKVYQGLTYGKWAGKHICFEVD